MQITPHLSYEEVIRTSTGLPNEPTETQLERIRLLSLHVFEPLRDHRGGPIRVNSCFRSEAVNKAVGGSETSQHCANNGAAMDLDITKEEFLWMKTNLDYDQLIYEFGDDKQPGWVHVSYVHNRNEVLQSYKSNGRTKYKHA